MGAIISAFGAVIDLASYLGGVAKSIFDLFPVFMRNPLKFFLQLMLLLVAAALGFVIWLLYIILSLIIEPIAYSLGLWFSVWFAIGSTVYDAALWAVHAAVTLVIYVADFFTGGWLFSLTLCENYGLESWATLGNFANGNGCSRSLLMCSRPCTSRYSPILGGTMCSRNPTYMPSLCPQSLIYRKFIAATDANYSAILEATGSRAGPDVVDKINPDPSFKLLSEARKRRYLKNAYSNKTSFLTQCYENMPSDPLTRNVCQNVQLLMADGPDRDLVLQACSQIYCQYKYVPKGVKPATVQLRSNREAEAFCKNEASLYSPPDTSEDRSEVMNRIFFWLVASIVLYMIVLSLQRVYSTISR